jgi:3-methyladenine DNA glycosylase AlkD
MNAKGVITALMQHADPVKAEHAYQFFKAFEGGYGEGEEFLGIRVPPQRKIAKANRNMPLNEVEILLRNPYHEVRLTALYLLVYRIEKANEEELKAVYDLYMNNLDRVNNWDLVDSSARFIVGKYLENRDRSVLYKLARSKNLWEKRIAMISCHHFIARLHQFEDALNIAEILLKDEHDLIHKAVGWMIREVGIIDMQREIDFLNLHYRKMPRTMLRYAIEKFDEPLRLQYLHGEV